MHTVKMSLPIDSETITPGHEKRYTRNQQGINVPTYRRISTLVPPVSFHSYKYRDVNATGKLINIGQSRVIWGLTDLSPSQRLRLSHKHAYDGASRRRAREIFSESRAAFPVARVRP